MDSETCRRAVRVALRLGVIMLSSGAQAQEAESSLLDVMVGFGLEGGDAIVTSSSVTVSYVDAGDAETTTAIQAVRRWRYDLAQVAAADALANRIGKGQFAIHEAEDELDRIQAMVSPYPWWLRFAAPALLSAAVTIMFGGSLVDSLATLSIGLAIQPALERIELSSLPLFFQVVFGVSATTLLVILLAGLNLPVDSGLVLTGSLLRFLPGAQLVNGMRDLIARAIVPGAANLAEAVLLGAAVAASVLLVLIVGESVLGIQIRIAAEGRHNWPAIVTVAAGSAAVAAYCIRLGVPPRILPSVTILGALAVFVSEGITSLSGSLDRDGRTLIAALMIGLVGRYLAERWETPAALWLIPAILPLLPAPSMLLPLLAETKAARDALQGQALTTAFLIGIGVASGDILMSTYQQYRERLGARFLRKEIDTQRKK